MGSFWVKAFPKDGKSKFMAIKVMVFYSISLIEFSYTHSFPPQLQVKKYFFTSGARNILRDRKIQLIELRLIEQILYINYTVFGWEIKIASRYRKFEL